MCASKKLRDQPAGLPQRKRIMDQLPNEVTSRVISFLPIPDRLRCTMVSKTWRRLTPSFWDVAADVLETLNAFNACSHCSEKMTSKGCVSCGKGDDDWIWLGDDEEDERDKSSAGFWFIRSDPRRKPTYPSALEYHSVFAAVHRKCASNALEYSKFAHKLMPTAACSVLIPVGATSMQENRFKLMFNFTVAAVNRLSEHHMRGIRDILNGNGGIVIPNGVYPTMDAFYGKSPFRYMVMWELCSLKMAADELFGAYDMYHFRSDFRGSNGRVSISDSGGSSLNDGIDDRMCGIFGFQGYHNGEKDPYMKPNVSAPLYGVEPGSKTHVDYILNVRGQYDDALIAVFGRDICARFFDPMRQVRELWPIIAKAMQAMGDKDDEVYSAVDDDNSFLFSDDDDDDVLEEGYDEDCDSFECDDEDVDDDDDYDDDDDDLDGDNLDGVNAVDDHDNVGDVYEV